MSEDGILTLIIRTRTKAYGEHSRSVQRSYDELVALEEELRRSGVLKRPEPLLPHDVDSADGQRTVTRKFFSRVLGNPMTASFTAPDAVTAFLYDRPGEGTPTHTLRARSTVPTAAGIDRDGSKAMVPKYDLADDMVNSAFGLGSLATRPKRDRSTLREPSLAFAPSPSIDRQPPTPPAAASPPAAVAPPFVPPSFPPPVALEKSRLVAALEHRINTLETELREEAAALRAERAARRRESIALSAEASASTHAASASRELEAVAQTQVANLIEQVGLFQTSHAAAAEERAALLGAASRLESEHQRWIDQLNRGYMAISTDHAALTKPEREAVSAVRSAKTADDTAAAADAAASLLEQRAASTTRLLQRLQRQLDAADAVANAADEVRDAGSEGAADGAAAAVSEHLRTLTVETQSLRAKLASAEHAVASERTSASERAALVAAEGAAAEAAQAGRRADEAGRLLSVACAERDSHEIARRAVAECEAQGRVLLQGAYTQLAALRSVGAVVDEGLIGSIDKHLASPAPRPPSDSPASPTSGGLRGALASVFGRLTGSPAR